MTRKWHLNSVKKNRSFALHFPHNIVKIEGESISRVKWSRKLSPPFLGSKGPSYTHPQFVGGLGTQVPSGKMLTATNKQSFVKEMHI